MSFLSQLFEIERKPGRLKLKPFISKDRDRGVCMISGLAEEMACTFPVIKVICFSLHYPTQDCHLCFVLFCFFLKETVWGYGNVLHLNRAEIHRYLFVKTKFHLIHFIIYKGQKVNIRRVFRRILVDAYNLPFFLLFIFN